MNNATNQGQPDARITEPPVPDEGQLQRLLATQQATLTMPPAADEAQLRRVLEAIDESLLRHAHAMPPVPDEAQLRRAMALHEAAAERVREIEPPPQ